MPTATRLSGIRLPEIAVPLGTYTGWNLRKPSIGAPDELYSMVGSFIPFSRDKQVREQTHDPRLSIEERYASEDEFLKKIEDAARTLVAARYLLPMDIPLVHRRAARGMEFCGRRRGPLNKIGTTRFFSIRWKGIVPIRST